MSLEERFEFILNDLRAQEAVAQADRLYGMHQPESRRARGVQQEEEDVPPSKEVEVGPIAAQPANPPAAFAFPPMLSIATPPAPASPVGNKGKGKGEGGKGKAKEERGQGKGVQWPR